MNESKCFIAWKAGKGETQKYITFRTQASVEEFGFGEKEEMAEKEFCVIEVGQGFWTIVDLVDMKLALSRRWHLTSSKSDRVRYARTHVTRNSTRCLHQLLMGRSWIDHRNSNGLDNRRFNLRGADASLNSMNRRKILRQCSSIYKGVTKCSDRIGWVAQLRYKGHAWHKRFKTESEAALYYNELVAMHVRESVAINSVIT